MAASRAARKREMIANLANEEYLNDLVNESCSSTDFALIYNVLRKARVADAQS